MCYDAVAQPVFTSWSLAAFLLSNLASVAQAGAFSSWIVHVDRVCLRPQNLRRVALLSRVEQTSAAGGTEGRFAAAAIPAGAATKPGGSGVAPPGPLGRAGTHPPLTAGQSPAVRPVNLRAMCSQRAADALVW
jgi:hypothetical protein